MIQTELLNYCLSIHGALLLAAVLAYYKYGDRTDILQKSRGDTERFLGGLREKVILDLGEALDTLMRESGTNPSISPFDNSYTERPTSLADSEAFRETLRDFIESDVKAIADYKIALSAFQSWCGWFKRISWSILLLIIWELICIALIGVLDKVFSVELPNLAIQLTVLPSSVAVAFIITCVFKMLVRHDKITEKKEKYRAISA
jgi:hypothetical protein